MQPTIADPRPLLNRAARRRLFRTWKAKEMSARRYIFEGRTTMYFKELPSERRASLKALREYMVKTGATAPVGGF